jgi:hypothetical protein
VDCFIAFTCSNGLLFFCLFGKAMQILTKLIYMEYIKNDNRVPYSLQTAVITVGIIIIHLSYFLNDRVTTSNDVDLPECNH